MPNVRLPLIVAASIVMAACGRGGGCGMGAMADTAGWQVVDAGPFVFKVPPGYREEVAQGVDSYIGRWHQGARFAGFDYGQYTRDPRQRPRAEGDDRVCTARISGREVAIEETEPPDARGTRRYVFLGWWRLGPVRDDTLGQPHLQLYAYAPADDADGRAEARTIVHSVRIRTVWTEQDRLRQRHRQCRDLREHVRGQPLSATIQEELRRCPSGPPPPPPDYERVR
jgi:hypothetical protein